MQSYEGIYENGVVRFLSPVTLPEHTKVVVTAQTDPNASSPTGCNTDKLYDLLSQSVETGIPDLAARHNEHQP